MADARSKTEVLALIEEQHAALAAVLATARDDEMTQPGVMGEWSAKDILAHITAWEQWLLRWLRGDAEALAQRRRMRDEFDTVVDEMNAATFAAHRDRALADVRAAFDASYQQALRTVQELADERLAENERVVAANTWEHYDEHAPALRAWIEGRRAAN